MKKTLSIFSIIFLTIFLFGNYLYAAQDKPIGTVLEPKNAKKADKAASVVEPKKTQGAERSATVAEPKNEAEKINTAAESKDKETEELKEEGKFGHLKMSGRYIYITNGDTRHDVSAEYAADTNRSHLRGHFPLKGSMYKVSGEYSLPETLPCFLPRFSLDGSYTGSALTGKSAYLREDAGGNRNNPWHLWEFNTRPTISIWDANLSYKLLNKDKFSIEPFLGYQSQRQYFRSDSANWTSQYGVSTSRYLNNNEIRYSEQFWGAQLGLKAAYSAFNWLSLNTKLTYIPYLSSHAEGREDYFGITYKHHGVGQGVNAEVGLNYIPQVRFLKEHVSFGLGYLFNWYKTTGGHATVFENNSGIWKDSDSNLTYSRSWSQGVFGDMTVSW